MASHRPDETQRYLLLMIVHIQGDKIPHHFDAVCALYGAPDLGLDYRLVTYDQVVSGELDIRRKFQRFLLNVHPLRIIPYICTLFQNS